MPSSQSFPPSLQGLKDCRFCGDAGFALNVFALQAFASVPFPCFFPELSINPLPGTPNVGLRLAPINTHAFRHRDQFPAVTFLTRFPVTNSFLTTTRSSTRLAEDEAVCRLCRRTFFLTPRKFMLSPFPSAKECPAGIHRFAGFFGRETSIVRLGQASSCPPSSAPSWNPRLRQPSWTIVGFTAGASARKISSLAPNLATPPRHLLSARTPSPSNCSMLHKYL